MNPLSGVFGAAIALRNTLFDRGILPALVLERPVVSVGNLSSGGAGKTPFVIALGELLKQRGIPFDVLSRGYGRKTRGALVVDPAGTASHFGDEPLLIARKLGVPVVVGESRYEAGRVAEERFHTQLHILDDGFQHRSLARDFDIVLIGAGDLEGRLLPVGRMREPVSSLRRADAIVLPEGLVIDTPTLRAKPIWRMQREIHLTPVDRANLQLEGTALVIPQVVASASREGTALAVPLTPSKSGGFSPGFTESAVIFCGIARPSQFFTQVRAAGIVPVAEVAFRDHHAYDERDVQRLLKMRDELGARAFLTTEKDAINLGSRVAALDPLAVAVLKVTVDRPSELVDTILARIAGRKPRS